MGSQVYEFFVNARCWLPWFTFQQFPTFFIRSFPSLLQLTFVLVYGPCFFAALKPLLPSGIFYFARSNFLLSFVSSSQIVYIKNFFKKISLCIGEDLNLPLPPVTLQMSMTMSWTTNTTQKTKMQSTDFSGLDLNSFLHLSSEIFPRLFQLTFFPFNLPCLFDVSQTHAFIGVV